MMIRRAYASQLTYGQCGHLICTPVSCALAVAWLSEGLGTFTAQRVSEVMTAGHKLVMSENRTMMMMLSDLYDRIPTTTTAFEEIAGPVCSPPRCGPTTRNSCGGGSPLPQADNIIIQPLTVLLRHCAKPTAAGPCALVVTAREHTTCYLMDGTGTMLRFDPLPASLEDVTHTWRHEDRLMATARATPTEYSGILLYKKPSLMLSQPRKTTTRRGESTSCCI